MLKKCFMIAALLAGVASFALDGKLMSTLAPNIEDQFAHIMPFRAPSVPYFGQCVRNQPVRLHLVLANPAVGKDGKVLVLVESIKSINPNGKVKELVEPGKPKIALQGVKKSKRDFSGVMLAGPSIEMILEDGDPLGKWWMVFTVRDRGDNSTREFAAEIELVEKLPGEPEKPMTAGEMSAFLTGYYKKPDPAKIPAAFAAFLKWDAEDTPGKRAYDPLMWLCGFAELYKLNPQLRPGLIKSAAEYSDIHKLYVALILAEAGAEDAELAAADPELKRLFSEIKTKGATPLAFETITNPAQLDALWMKFLVTGKFEPIRRLVYELRKRDGAMTLDELKKLGRKPTEKEIEKVMPSLIGGAAEWSLASNAKQHRLVAFYLEAMLGRKQYPDDGAAAKIGGMLIKAGVLEMKKTPEGKTVLRPVKRSVGGKPAPGKGYDPLGD